MNLESIISITGKPGLFKVVSQTKSGLIVEAIADGKRTPVQATDKVSALNDISIYTNEGDIPLLEVYEILYKKTAGKEAISHKAKPEELRAAMKDVVEDFDQDRVYNSDLKKLFQWFNTLIVANLLKPEEKEASAENKDGAKKAPAKKAPAKKKTAVKKPSPKTSGAKGGGKVATPSKHGK